MLASTKARLLGGALLLVAVLTIARLLSTKDTPSVPTWEPAKTTVQEIGEPRDRGRRTVPVSARAGGQTRKSRAAKSTTSTLPIQTPPLEGYLVDDFRGWATLPDGYIAENVRVAGGAVRVRAGDGRSSAPVVGMLESPPLPLRQPSLAAPAASARPLPEGSEVQLQLRLSADGREWTPWAMAELYQKPDGNLALPAGGPSLMPGTVPSVEAGYLVPETSGPLVRYRLSITLRGGHELVLRDVRLWKKKS